MNKTTPITSIRNPDESADEERIGRMVANPFYCIRVHRSFCRRHELIYTEDQFIEMAMKFIRQQGAEVFLRHLLANLKGEYV